MNIGVPHKTNNSCSYFLSCLHLQLVAFDIFPSVIQHLFQLYSYYFVDMYTQMKRCSVHKIDNCSRLFHLSPFAILDCFYFKISICKFKTLCGILIILSSISSYLPLHICIELHSYTLRYVHLGEWAFPVRGKTITAYLRTLDK